MMFVGDAAAFIDPFVGDGIPSRYAAAAWQRTACGHFSMGVVRWIPL